MWTTFKLFGRIASKLRGRLGGLKLPKEGEVGGRRVFKSLKHATNKKLITSIDEYGEARCIILKALELIMSSQISTKRLYCKYMSVGWFP